MSINPTNPLPSSVKPKERPASTLDQKPSSKKNVLTKKIAKLFKKKRQVSASSKSGECDLPKFKTQLPLSVRPKTKRSIQRENLYDSPKFGETLDIQAPNPLETDTTSYQTDRRDPMPFKTQSSSNVDLIQKKLEQWQKDFSNKVQEYYLNQPSSQKAPRRIVGLNCKIAFQRILAFLQKADEKTLDLSNLNLSSLPDVFYFPSFQNRLSEINLGQNKLTSLPQSFENLQTLTKLYLNGNHLAEFPELLVKLPNLKELDLSQNKLTQLPESLAELRELQQLLVRGNQLTTLPISLGQLHKLEVLELGINKLKNLPGTYVNLTSLKDLSISHNNFVELPEFIGSLPSLEILRIRNNKYKNLPKSFIHLKTLKKIYLAHNDLSELSLETFNQFPCKMNGLEYTRFQQEALNLYRENFGSYQEDQYTTKSILSQWQQINTGGARVQAGLSIQNFCKKTNEKKLNLNQLDLVDLPNIFHFEPFASRLEQLDVSDNKLQELPSSIHSLKVLKTLNLSNNQFSNDQFSDLPEFFLQSETLTHLNLDGNKLTVCPKFLCNLPRLEMLNLSNNGLVFDLKVILSNLQNLKDLDLSYNSNLVLLDDQISPLLAIDKINLTGCSSLAFLNNNENISPSHILPSPMETEKTIIQSLKQLCQITKRKPIDLCPLLKVREVRSWLDRLFFIADFQKGGDIRKALAINVLDCLSEANSNPTFRQVFTTTIRGATESCEDRVALSFIDANLAYQLATIDTHNMRELADFLIQGPCSIAILRGFAQQLILKSPSADQIEVYLGLLVKLKMSLSLPINIEEMSYFKLSELTSKNLDDAEKCVLKARRSSRFELLISQDKWKEALKAQYSSEFKHIEEERDVAMQEGKNEETIMKTFNKKLIKLTSKALQAESFR